MKYITTEKTLLWAVEFPAGSTVHLNRRGVFHNSNGPAIIWPNGQEEWWFEGHAILHNTTGNSYSCCVGTPANYKRPDRGFVVRSFPSLSLKEQKFVAEHRPDLLHKILNLDPSLQEKYKDELNLARIEI
jgi:hypothetical protein